MSDLTAAVGGALFVTVAVIGLGYLLVAFRRSRTNAGFVVMDAAVHGLGANRDEWRRAMLAELTYIPDSRERTRFALGSLGLILKDDKWGVVAGLVLALMSFPWAGLLHPAYRSFSMGGLHPVIVLPVLMVGVAGWTGGSWTSVIRAALSCAVAGGLLISVGGVGMAWLTADVPSLGDAARTGLWMLAAGSASGFLIGLTGAVLGLVAKSLTSLIERYGLVR